MAKTITTSILMPGHFDIDESTYDPDESDDKRLKNEFLQLNKDSDNACNCFVNIRVADNDKYKKTIIAKVQSTTHISR